MSAIANTDAVGGSEFKSTRPRQFESICSADPEYRPAAVLVLHAAIGWRRGEIITGHRIL
jgi:hypothetical protein